jgi:hypothetical protein
LRLTIYSADPSDPSGTIVGWVEMSADGSVIRATGIGVETIHLGATELETGEWLRVTDGPRWLRAVRHEYRSGYYYAEVDESVGDPRAAMPAESST